MREDFCAFILTHGRPDRVHTARTLRSHGYSGQIFIVIDDEDETGEEYKRTFGDDVLVVSQDEAAKYTDPCDNFSGRNSPLWKRNACWDLARRTGYRYFIQLDDDYKGWHYRRMGKGHRLSSSIRDEFHSWKLGSLDAVFEALVLLIETTPIKTIALAQGGDYIGGEPYKTLFRRKAMNSFVCDRDKPFLFRGRLNDDVNTYVSLGAIGDLFFTYMGAYLSQERTQANRGGITDIYLKYGTYVKSFYTVMTAPSCTHIGLMGNIHKRLHHRINWRKAVPLIIAEPKREKYVEARA